MKQLVPQDPPPLTRPPQSAKRPLAIALDFFSVLLLAGYLIARLHGSTTETGFELHGLPALACFAVIGAYFALGHFLGGTIWSRVLGVRGSPFARTDRGKR